jgi:hypothetical protein
MDTRQRKFWTNQSGKPNLNTQFLYTVTKYANFMGISWGWNLSLIHEIYALSPHKDLAKSTKLLMWHINYCWWNFLWNTHRDVQFARRTSLSLQFLQSAYVFSTFIKAKEEPMPDVLALVRQLRSRIGLMGGFVKLTSSKLMLAFWPLRVSAPKSASHWAASHKPRANMEEQQENDTWGILLETLVQEMSTYKLCYSTCAP